MNESKNYIRQVGCTCGRNANLYKIRSFGVYLIVCDCGKRTGADTEARTLELWRGATK